MAASLNKVILIGNLTRDPELKYTASGNARTRFAIAINRQYKDPSGQLQEEVTYVPVVVWGAQAENCASYLKKGWSVAVEGRLRIDSFENQEGEKKQVVEVVAQGVQFLRSPRSSSEPGSAPAMEDAPAKDLPPEEEVPF